MSEPKMRRIVVINPKGGCGKTTIAVTLAGFYAARGDRPVLMDYDPQGSSSRWFQKRALGAHPMHSVAAWERDFRTTRSFRLRVPPMSTRVIVDTPAAVDAHSLPDLTRDADKIIVPVLPSDIDVHACTRIIADLLLVAKIRRAENRIGVVANRVKRNTLMYRSLQRFLGTLNVPVITSLRDSQNYIRSAELGVGLHEMKRHTVADDLAQWQPLIDWLECDAKPSAETSRVTPFVGPAAAAPTPWDVPAGALMAEFDFGAQGPVFGKTAG
jgi:chromosome partitioning protein